MAGGSEVVKIKPGAWLRIKSTSAAEPAMYPPIVPKAFPSVPWTTVGRCMTPSRSAIPPPRGPVQADRRRQPARLLHRGDIARGKNQGRLAAVQIGDLAFEQQVDMAVA